LRHRATSAAQPIFIRAAGIGHLTDVQEFNGASARMHRRTTSEKRDRQSMRLSENWWERLATLARFAPILITLIGVIVVRPMGYYWE
jgi:hypothetical protein